LAGLLDFSKRFYAGINLDDAWRYAGLREPKSIMIPYLFSLRINDETVFGRMDDAVFRRYGVSGSELMAEKAILSLAEDLADMKVKFVRCWFSWRFFEPSLIGEDRLDALLESSYQEWPLDGLVDMLFNRGIDLVPVLGCGYERMLPQGLSVDKDRDLYLKRIAIHVRLLTRRYKAKIKHWQIENEPNWWRKHSEVGWRSGGTWMDPGGFRERLLKTLNDAVHEEDSGATTIINLEGDGDMGDLSIYSQLSDMFGLDFYPNYKSSSPINTSVFSLADKVSKDTGKPVIISETGYPSGPRPLGYTRVKQAQYVKMACENAFALDGINGIGIWRYRDTTWRSFPPQENRFGLKDNEGNPKPAWDTFRDTISKLG
jgi:hypothetical protein